MKKKEFGAEIQKKTAPPSHAPLRSVRSVIHLSSTEAAASLPPPNFLAKRCAPYPPSGVCVIKGALG